MGRSKTFDQLVAELKTKVREKGSSSVDGASSTGHCQGPSAAKEQSGATYYRRPLASLPAFRFSPSSQQTAEQLPASLLTLLSRHFVKSHVCVFCKRVNQGNFVLLSSKVDLQRSVRAALKRRRSGWMKEASELRLHWSTAESPATTATLKSTKRLWTSSLLLHIPGLLQ